MTKEEAKKEICKAFEPAFANYIITALEENATVSDGCEDAVSRERALLMLTGKNLSTKSTDKLLALFNKRIKALPPVAPARKKGKWVKHKNHHGNIYYNCSLCGCRAPCMKTEDGLIWKLSNYCPDCGAKMERREEHMYQEEKKKDEE